MQVGQQALGKTADAVLDMIDIGTDAVETLFEEFLCGLAMGTRTVLIMLSVVAVSAAGSVILCALVRKRLRSIYFGICCMIAGGPFYVHQELL